MTVLLTSYGRPESLGRAIASVVSQTYDNWRMVIMDDGSSAATEIRRLVHRPSPVTQIRRVIKAHSDPRIGVQWFDTTVAERRATVRYASLINWGAAHSEGDYLTYLADDDWYHPDRLQRMVDKLAEGHDVVYGTQDLLDAHNHLTGRRVASEVLTSASFVVDHNSVMHTRESFEVVGGWPTDPKFWRTGDAQFWDRLTDAGYVFVPVDDPERATDAKVFHDDSVDVKVQRGLDPW